jgi:hypothetical protein
LDFHGLATLDDLASLLADPGVRGERLRTRLREVAREHEITTTAAAGLSDEAGVELTGRLTPPVSPRQAEPTPPVAAPSTPAARATQPTPATSTPSTNGATALIDSSIAAIDALGSNPFGEPVPIPEDTLVPIESLLYRGRAALDRAVEIRDEMRRAGAQVDRIALEELFDLLELARAE